MIVIDFRPALRPVEFDPSLRFCPKPESMTVFRLFPASCRVKLSVSER